MAIVEEKSNTKNKEKEQISTHNRQRRTYGGKGVDVLRAGLHGFTPAEVLQFHQAQHHLLARHADRGTLC